MPQLLSVAPMLKTREMRQTIDFYTVHLGFRLENTFPQDNPTWCSLMHDEVNIMFYSHDDHDPSPLKMTGRLYIKIDDVMTLYNRIKTRVKVIEQPEVYFYGMKEFAIEDNNGYCLVLAQETNEPPTCKESAEAKVEPTGKLTMDEAREMIQKMRQQLKSPATSDSADLIREDRER